MLEEDPSPFETEEVLALMRIANLVPGPLSHVHACTSCYFLRPTQTKKIPRLSFLGGSSGRAQGDF